MAPFSKRQYAVVLAVIRKTYGFNKKYDALSMWEIAAMTGIDRANVSRTVTELVALNVLVRYSGGRMSHGQYVPHIGLNKQYETWLTDAKSAQVKTGNYERGTDANLAQDTDAVTAPVPKHDRCQNSTGDRCQNDTATDANLAQQPMPKQHTQKTTQKTTKRQLPKDKGIEYPEWLDIDVWKQFVVFRKAIKAPLTEYAEKLAIQSLGKLRSSGQDPNAVIEQSIMHGWKGLYAVKSGQEIKNPAGVQAIPGRSTSNKRVAHDDDFGSKQYTGTPLEDIDWLRGAS